MSKIDKYDSYSSLKKTEGVSAQYNQPQKYNGKNYHYNIEKVTEFAIPVSKLKTQYLTSYEIDQSHHDALEQVKSLIELIRKDVFKNSNLPELQKKPKQKPDSGSQDGPVPSL